MLQKYRIDIDKIDKKIILLLKKRKLISQKMLKYKNKIEDKSREKEIFEKLNQLANEHNLRPEFLNKLYKIILKESHKYQKEIKNK
ncbi:chorismate mutase [Candidatus Woesearchaeota archaeon]|jgi:chorismate mutase / prephenate dehydratase|nr:chorismate mutase [Candidatus Woesearchaeota archaeon]MBT4387312.1 chorismate mutase [Candidatus Woesearchaeota archaeon]MBT4595451.1 chorismate mutase [Candidatus Woesearchaeota archaeon]MBT5741166.1 chorismate mutase [Candidatus Woesearchaeota archaeon]MBT6505932.1 chorismate mutase [Candidatus Woesearchaeota archaeon]